MTSDQFGKRGPSSRLRDGVKDSARKDSGSITGIVTIVVGALLTGATIAGVAKSVSDTGHRSVPSSSTANVQLYGSH